LRQSRAIDLMNKTNLENPELEELKREPQGDWPRIHAAVVGAAVFWLVALFVWGAYVGKVAHHGAH